MIGHLFFGASKAGGFTRNGLSATWLSVNISPSPFKDLGVVANLALINKCPSARSHSSTVWPAVLVSSKNISVPLAFDSSAPSPEKRSSSPPPPAFGGGKIELDGFGTQCMRRRHSQLEEHVDHEDGGEFVCLRTRLGSGIQCFAKHNMPKHQGLPEQAIVYYHCRTPFVAWCACCEDM